jgi:hypothetical protein
MSSTPPNSTTSPIARSLVIDSLSAKRAIRATKKGAEFSSTDATAAPARSVPTLIAQIHSRRVRGRRLLMNGKRMVSRAPPASARRVAIMIGEVWFSAESVTG